MYFSQSEHIQVINTQIKIQKLHFGRNNLKLNHQSRKSRDIWITGKFGLGVQNEAEPRLAEFCQETALVIASTLFQQHEMTLHMDITRWSIPKSDWLYFFVAKDGEALYSQKKQDQELTVAQIMDSLLQNSALN